MEFDQKLNSLMKTFSISNSRLAMALSVDPSLISRWRNGNRSPSKKNRYIEAIASFFVSRIEKASQRAALLEILNLPPDLPLSAEELEHHVLQWLDSSPRSEDSMIDKLLTQMQSFGTPRMPADPPSSDLSLPEGEITSIQTYYGLKEKQAGVLQFLSLAMASPTPITLLMYSDENMDWLNADPEYFSVWGYMAGMLLKKGHRIRIIHTLQRDLTEMHEAIERWMPLYMTGAIEPSYYPRYREQIFRRTLFIAPGIAAFTSVSLPDTAETATHQLITDPGIISSYAEEFTRFQTFCRPLMKIVSGSDMHTFPSLREELDTQQGNMIASGVFPSSLTLPPDLLPALFLEDCSAKDRVLTQHQERIHHFIDQLKDHTYTEILFLPQNDLLLERAYESDFALNYFTDHLRYTQDTLRHHLLHIVSMLEDYPNFYLYMVPNPNPGSVHITAKEDVGVLIQKVDHPHIAFAFNQPNLTHSFYHYLESIAEQTPREKRSKDFTIKKLQNMADRLENQN